MNRALRFLALLLLFSCGARTGLIVFESTDGGDAGVLGRDGGHDAKREADALPPIDAPHDATSSSDCPDAGATLIYLVADDDRLMSFYPPTMTFKQIGTLSCPDSNGSHPNSMAVDRAGTAYVGYLNGSLYQVNTSNAQCVSTSFSPSPMDGFDVFGMAFTHAGTTDRLYVAGHAGIGNPSAGLATIGTLTFAFKFIGEFQPELNSPELTGNAVGRLFGWSPNPDNGSTLVEIDPKSARLVAADHLSIGMPVDHFAVALWGGDFYIFAGDVGTNVIKYDPVTKKETLVVSTPERIGGAGVSTCAP